MAIEQLTRPTQAEGLVGWRAWKVRKRIVARNPDEYTHTLGYSLRSLYEENAEMDEWRPGRATHARCHRSRKATPAHKRGEVPHPACQCGYSAYRELTDLLRNLGGSRHSNLVIGEVVLWGDVLVEEHGIRSSFAYPSSVYVIRNWWAWQLDEASLAAESLGIYGIPSRSRHSNELPG